MVNVIETLKERLKNDTVSFTYTKKDGTTRTARGTTKHSIIAEAGGSLPNGVGYEYTDTTTRYFDLSSNGWRSFVNDNLVSIDD